MSITVRDIDNMGDSAKEGGTAAGADSYFINKNGYKLFCKYWHPELKDGEQPRYGIPKVYPGMPKTVDDAGP